MNPIARITNTAWLRSRNDAGIRGLHYHDLRDTFGYRLREAGVSEEDRRDLLRHGSRSITTHYSAADIKKLFDCAELVSKNRGSKPPLRIVQC